MDNNCNAKVYYIGVNQLFDFVRDIAEPGDIAMSYDALTESRYIYFCTHENIGEEVNPLWTMYDEKAILRERVKHMTLEEKIDFLVDKFIERMI